MVVGLLTTLCGACQVRQPVVFPRTAEIVKPNRVRAGIAFGHTEAPAHTEFDSAGPHSLRVTEADTNTAITGDLDAGESVASAVFFAEGDMRVGLLPGCEVGALGGPSRIGAELRCGLPPAKGMSLALSGGVLATYPQWRPIFKTYQGRIGIDASTPTDNTVVTLGFYASFGSQWHFVGERGIRQFIGRPDTILVRRQLELAVPIGYGWSLAPTGLYLFVGGVAGWTPYAGEPRVECNCDDDPLSVIAFQQDYEVTGLLRIGY